MYLFITNWNANKIKTYLAGSFSFKNQSVHVVIVNCFSKEDIIPTLEKEKQELFQTSNTKQYLKLKRILYNASAVLEITPTFKKQLHQHLQANQLAYLSEKEMLLIR